MEKLFAPREAARLVDVPLTSVNNWLLRSREVITTPAGNGRPRFDRRGLRILAVMSELCASGIKPDIAALWAASVVDRARRWPLVAVFARDPNASPCLVPQDVLPEADAVVVVSLAPIFRRIDKAVGDVSDEVAELQNAQRDDLWDWLEQWVAIERAEADQRLRGIR